MIPGQQKKKGNRVELEFAKLLTKRFGQEFKRTPSSGMYGTMFAKTNIQESVKEILSGDLICPKGFRFSIEIKSRMGFNFWDLINKDTKNEIDEWISQSEGDAKIAGKEMLVIVKINNRKPFVIYDNKDNRNGILVYKNKYLIQRLDDFLEIKDEFFWVKLNV